jgi:hypothetical protein
MQIVKLVVAMDAKLHRNHIVYGLQHARPSINRIYKQQYQKHDRSNLWRQTFKHILALQDVCFAAGNV